jgi:hypothetical protein
LAGNIKTNKKKSILFATEHPLLLIKQKKDTLYIAADTLHTGKIADLARTIPKARDSIGKIKDTTLDKYFEAYHHVRIYSDSLQAKADSLFYSLNDSTIRLLSNPIVWANENQITGDTIYLYVKNKKPEQLYVFENAFAINKIDSSEFYNQLKGNKLNAWFDDGSITKMRTKGNAENIYFALDNDKKFIGVNHSNAQIIEITFENNEPAKVVFRNQLTGNMYTLWLLVIGIVKTDIANVLKANHCCDTADCYRSVINFYGLKTAACSGYRNFILTRITTAEKLPLNKP